MAVEDASSNPSRRNADRVLVARCLAGERAAQRALFEREKKRVHATLYRIVGHNRGMDDMLQDTFIAVFRSLHQYRGDALLSTWIDRCAVHVAFRHLRASRGAKLVEMGDTLAAPEASAERRTGLRQAAERLYAVLETLEPKMRVAYTLHVLEDRPLSEVADITDATLVATKLRIWRARRHVEQRARHDPLLAEFVGAALNRADHEEADA